MSPRLTPRRQQPPVPLERSERALASAQDGAGNWVVASDRALVSGARRLSWVDVAHARWDDEAGALVVDPVDPETPVWRLVLPEPGRVPETVHERVVASIVVSRQVAVPGGSVRVVAREAGDGSLSWQVVADRGVDPGSPEVRAAADRAVAALRGELGR